MESKKNNQQKNTGKKKLEPKIRYIYELLNIDIDEEEKNKIKTGKESKEATQEFKPNEKNKVIKSPKKKSTNEEKKENNEKKEKKEKKKKIENEKKEKNNLKEVEKIEETQKYERKKNNEIEELGTKLNVLDDLNKIAYIDETNCEQIKNISLNKKANNSNNNSQTNGNNIISDNELEEIEKTQINEINKDDFEYIISSEIEDNKDEDFIYEKMEKDLLKNDNGKKKELDKSNIQNKILEENDLNNESNSVGSNIKNTEKYSKENWKKLIDIPNIRMGKKFSVNSSTEYSIENKYINGGDLQIIKDNTELKYFKNIEFQGKKFLIFTKKADILKYYRIYYYCKNHRMSKTSEKLDDKGNKVRINLCNAKIKYEITSKKYSMIGNHSEECENLSNSLVTNYAEIKVEINNYQNFKDILKSYLKEYPIITFPEFKKYGQKIYYENKHNFPINNNFYSNIYYNWRKMSNLFNKNSIFENQKTSDGLQFLRDYSLSLLYKKIINHN